jgi:DNA-binding response OmpR family regulator
MAQPTQSGTDVTRSSAHADPARGGSAVVAVYSPRASLRSDLRTAVGRRPVADGPRIDWLECATDRELKLALDSGEVDLAILDGEAQPTGGMGLARKYKNELADCPPLVVLTARAQDAWLANWSLADAVLAQPVEPIGAAATVGALLVDRVRTIPVVR